MVGQQKSIKPVVGWRLIDVQKIFQIIYKFFVDEEVSLSIGTTTTVYFDK